MSDVPPIVSIVGKKNSGKTTLVVALAAEMRLRGHRLASIKHGHHGFEIDHPGTDSWRHFHEGEVEAVVFVAADRLALVMRTAVEEDPARVVERFFSGRGYGLVLCEGYKHGPFPKVEIYRRASHRSPLVDLTDPGATERYLAVVTDDPALEAVCPVIPLDAPIAGAHVQVLADRIEEWLIEQGARA